MNAYSASSAIDAEAWLLHKYPDGDTSLRLILFIRDLGVISCIYKGGRSLKKRAAAEPFVPLWVSLSKKNTLYYVRSLEPRGAPLSLRQEALYSAIYLNELIVALIKPQDSYPNIYENYVYTLTCLAQTREFLAIEALLRLFEWNFIKVSGYDLLRFETLELEKCYFEFRPDRGFVKTVEGLSFDEALALINAEFEDLKILKLAKKIMRQAINYLLDGKELRSRLLFAHKR